MITPDPERAKKEVVRLHDALDGVLMCYTHNSPAYDLAINVRSKLRQIHRLLTGSLYMHLDEDDTE